MTRRTNLFSNVLLSLALAGCGSPATSPPNRPARLSNSDTSGSDSSWVTSDDGVLELRLLVKSQQVASKESIHVVATIRNLSQQQVTVLRPFGDWYAARALGMKIWDAKQQIRYTGPHATYVIGADAFAVIAPGETVEDQLELTIDNFAGLERPESYAIRFDYSYQGQWDTTAAVGDSGISNAWRGKVSSREVEILRR